MLSRIIKILGIVLIGFFVIIGVTYGYLAAQEGQAAADHPFFSPVSKHPLVIAHRGGAGIFPENTLTAFQESWKLGVDVLEMDVHETADKKIVVIHDKTVDRTTDGQGKISEKSLEEIKRLNAGFRFTADGGQTFPFREKNIGIPTLDEIFQALPNARFNIEMKPTSTTIATTLCRQIREYRLTEKVVVASVSQSNLDEFRRQCPETATSGSASEVIGFISYYQSGLNQNYSPPMPVLQILRKFLGLPIVSKEFIEAAHKHNLQVQVWTVNNPEEMESLIKIGIDGIMTDHPDKLLEVRDKMQIVETKSVP